LKKYGNSSVWSAWKEFLRFKGFGWLQRKGNQIADGRKSFFRIAGNPQSVLPAVYCFQKNRKSTICITGSNDAFVQGNRVAGSKEIHCPDCRKCNFHSDGNNLTGLSEIGLRMEGNPFAGLPSNPMPSSGNLRSDKGNPLSGQRNPFSG